MKYVRPLLWSLMLCALILIVPQTVSAKTVSAKLSTGKVKVGGQAKVSATTKNVTYSSSDTTIAYVDAEGIVTGKKAGNVEIRVKREGYETRSLSLTVEKAARKPSSLPVAVGEAKIVKPSMTQKADGSYQFSAQVKNTSKDGTIKKIIYTYEIQVADKTADDTGDADDGDNKDDADHTEDGSSTDDGSADNEDSTDASAGAGETADDLTANEALEAQLAAESILKSAAKTSRKTVTLTAKSVKAGKTSKKVTCTGDASGQVESMKLVKVQLYTGKALYVYHAKKQTGTFKWGVADTTAPTFSGWIESKSAYNGCVLRVCYTDRKNTYNFKEHVKATDDRDKSVTIKVDTSKINWKKEGIYKVYYTATDKAGNKAKTWTKVQVYKKGTAEEIADNVLSSITKSSWSDERKLRAIYSYVKNHCSYINEGMHGNFRKVAVNGIRYRSGDCITFYSVSRLLISRAGIPNIMINRYPDNIIGRHFWNLVYVRGGWYHFDTCPRSRDGYFCLQTDAQLRRYSTGYTFSFNKSLYPARATKVISRNP